MTLKAICGWSYYSIEENFKKEIPDFPGKTIGREKETPTLLHGKENWKPVPDKYEMFIEQKNKTGGKL